jgi:hypothetical protein
MTERFSIPFSLSSRYWKGRLALRRPLWRLTLMSIYSDWSPAELRLRDRLRAALGEFAGAECSCDEHPDMPCVPCTAIKALEESK